MSIDIDRAHNVIINAGGVAHRTGWTVHFQYDAGGRTIGGTLLRGVGYYDRAQGLYRFRLARLADQKSIHFEGELTAAGFAELTRWEPGQ
jgi:hypothetical protein